MFQKEKILWTALKCLFGMMDSSTFLKSLFYIEQSLIKADVPPDYISDFSTNAIYCYFKEKEED